MNSNWFKIIMKATKVSYGKNLLLKGVPVIFNKKRAKLRIGDNVRIKVLNASKEFRTIDFQIIEKIKEKVLILKWLLTLLFY